MANADKGIFSKVQHKRSAENVVEQILARIEEGVLQPGDKLESERVLSQEFGVSQPCIREALRALELMGILRVERGKGAFILDTLTSGNIWQYWASMNSAEVKDILEVREALDGKSIELAIRHRERLDYTQIEQNIQTMMASDQEGEMDYHKGIALDIEFHVLLAELSGNKLLVDMTRMVNKLVNLDRRSVFSQKGRHRQSAAEHQGIIQAIKSGERENASRLLMQHIDNTRKTLGY